MTEIEFREILRNAGIIGAVADCVVSEFHHQKHRPSTSNVDTWVDIYDDSRSDTKTLTPSDLNDQPADLHRFSKAVQDNTEYQDISLLGKGGMGEVRRVRDPQLSRNIAMKIINTRSLQSPDVLRRFIMEAQVCAQLEHPNIVPIYDIGVLKDGRVYYTMKEVKGEAFGIHIRQLHSNIIGNIWPTTGRTLIQLLLQFADVCAGMAYAHSKNVVHRDLKPENIMIGTFGEVLIVDWGLVKLLESDGANADTTLPIATSHSKHQNTILGTIAGTPAYMAPEQAKGQIDRIDHRTDIYALGAILYEILSGRPPYNGESGLDILEQVRTKPPLPLRWEDITGQPIETEEHTNQDFSHLAQQIRQAPLLPKPLVDICEKAMARRPEDRYQQTTDMLLDVQTFLDGSKKKEQAEEVVARASVIRDNIVALDQDIEKIRQQIMNSTLPSWAPIEEKKGLWLLEDQLAALVEKRREREGEQEYLLRAAFTHFPSCVSAHRELAQLYLSWHQAAERDGAERAPQLLQSLRRHVAFLPPSEAQSFQDYIEGNGSVSLYLPHHDNLLISIDRYIEKAKQLRPERLSTLQEHRIEELVLKKGSYRFVVEVGTANKSFQFVIPFLVERQTCTEIGSISQPIPLINPKEDCYVPAGFSNFGGDERAMNSLESQTNHLTGFIIQKYHVTNRDYISFLNELLDLGREQEALAYAPKYGNHEKHQTLYQRDQSGHFLPSREEDSVLSGWDWPVCFIDWHCCQAYAQWFSEKTGRLWRLPTELEWEKAARGSDQRIFPWGNRFDFAFCCIEDSQEEPHPVNVWDFPDDESPYGVRHTAGNMSEWTQTVWDPEGADDDPEDQESDRVIRGGYWEDYPRRARLACRDDGAVFFRDNYLGFRLVSLVEE